MPNIKLTYLADYDDLSSLNMEKKIYWVERRIKKVFINHVNKFLRDKQNPDLALGLMTLICCAIEAMGHFLRGRKDKKGSGEDFKLFIRKYMPEAKMVREDLYKYFRCGLAHAFTIKQGSIEGKMRTLFEEEKRRQSFYKVHPWKLFESLEHGIESYFKHLHERKREKLRKKFIDHFNYAYKFWIQNPPIEKQKGRLRK